jgi:hypothetical protein
LVTHRIGGFFCQSERLSSVDRLLSGGLFSVVNRTLSEIYLPQTHTEPYQCHSSGREQADDRKPLPRYLLGLCGFLLIVTGLKLVSDGVKRAKYGLVALAFPFYPLGLGCLLYALSPWWPFSP